MFHLLKTKKHVPLLVCYLWDLDELLAIGHGCGGKDSVMWTSGFIARRSRLQGTVTQSQSLRPSHPLGFHPTLKAHQLCRSSRWYIRSHC